MTTKNKSAPAADSTEQQLEEGLALLLSALPKLIIRWLKKK